MRKWFRICSMLTVQVARQTGMRIMTTGGFWATFQIGIHGLQALSDLLFNGHLTGWLWSHEKKTMVSGLLEVSIVGLVPWFAASLNASHINAEIKQRQDTACEVQQVEIQGQKNLLMVKPVDLDSMQDCNSLGYVSMGKILSNLG
ncbi:hypothetical protein F4678DRAFT_79777 [Xylaria arbuscula]|nr:hypothetical protein F4678DRAFT_79777 [Xylaria arbuscula]